MNIEQKTLKNGIVVELFPGTRQLFVRCIANGKVVERIQAGKSIRQALMVFDYVCECYGKMYF